MTEKEPTLSATQLGLEYGLNAQEMNVVLARKGFLRGEPGAYGLTELGEEFGVQKHHDNGYGGWAYRGWETTRFVERIRDAIDVSDSDKEHARDTVRLRREMQATQRSQSKQTNPESIPLERQIAFRSEGTGLSTGTVLIGVAVTVLTITFIAGGVAIAKRLRKKSPGKRSSISDSGADSDDETKRNS